MSFESQIEQFENIYQIKVSGRLDSSTSGQLEESLQTIFKTSHINVMMDLSQLDYISSAGLRVILSAAKRFKQVGSKFVLYGLNQNVHKVFEISGFLNMLKIANDRTAGIFIINN